MRFFITNFYFTNKNLLFAKGNTMRKNKYYIKSRTPAYDNIPHKFVFRGPGPDLSMGLGN